MAADPDDFYRFNGTDADKKWLAYSRAVGGIGTTYIPRFAIDVTNSSATQNYITVRLTDGAAYYTAGGGAGGGGATYPDTTHWTLTGTAADVNVTNFPASQAVTGTFWQATQPVSGTFWQVTQPVSGTVTANAGTNLNTSLLALDATLTNRTQKTVITDGTRDAVVKAGATLPVAATDPALVVTLRESLSTPVTGTFWQATQPVSGTFFQATQPVSGTVTANQGGAPWAENITQIGTTNVVTGGVAGTLGIGGTQGNNAAITANPVLTGLEARSSTPTAATNGNVIRSAGDLAGNQFNVMPIAWSCNSQNIGAALVQCQAAPSAGYSLYVTGWIALSSTSTAGTYRLTYGTGSNCGTGGTALFPAPGVAAGSRVMVLPANTAAPHVVSLGPVGIKIPAANALCVIGVATNTLDIILTGYTAP